MIKEAVDRWFNGQQAVRDAYSKQLPKKYEQIVKDVIKAINPTNDYDLPDPNRITVIDHGQYQGTQLFVIAETGYEPSNYFSVYVDYGSCSGCDTLERIRYLERSDESPTNEQVDMMMTLALHIVQGLKKLER